MFDKIISLLLVNNHRKSIPKNPNFTVKDIQKFFKYKKNSTTLKVILPGWSDGLSWVTKIFARHLSRKGFSCLVYSIPRTILPHNPHLAPEIFNLVRETIKKDISEIRSQHNFKNIDVIAPSLGAVIACLIANNNQDITNIFLLVPGSRLASGLWDGIRTQGLRQIYENQGFNKEKLEALWHTLAPKNNIDGLGGKKIFIAISKSDKVIPYGYGKELTELLKKLYSDTLIEENHYLGHYLTVVKYYLFSRVLLKK